MLGLVLVLALLLVLLLRRHASHAMRPSHAYQLRCTTSPVQTQKGWVTANEHGLDILLVRFPTLLRTGIAKLTFILCSSSLSWRPCAQNALMQGTASQLTIGCWQHNWNARPLCGNQRSVWLCRVTNGCCIMGGVAKDKALCDQQTLMSKSHARHAIATTRFPQHQPNSTSTTVSVLRPLCPTFAPAPLTSAIGSSLRVWPVQFSTLRGRPLCLSCAPALRRNR